MYLGIDLGTSNSAIVGNTKSSLRLFKTAEGTDVLPSVININKSGHRFVGNRAYQQALLSPENVAQRFKRLMGTNTSVGFAASGVTMTPEECSTEIIRMLLAQAKTESGEGEIEGAVITIPAAFNQMQSEATLRAAAAAGLEKVGLLQEPIAAAMASISQSKNKNAQFLVYDLGGGTFDVALVQSINGSVNIVAHEGINMLGGTDFDKSIVNAIVRPWLLSNFDLPENFQTEAKFQKLIGAARFAAEKAKIELSASENALIFASEEEIRVQDQSGADIYFSIDVTRKQIDDLIEDRITDSINLCRKVIKDNGYSNDDIDMIVLIGGPSKMPSIRARVPQELGIPADLNTDPMTAVAIGAAIFAESREWGEEGTTTRKASRTSTEVKGQVEVRYEYPARTSDDRAKIRVRPSMGTPRGCRLQIDAPDGWSSGVIDMREDLTQEVPLSNRGDNHFRVTVYDASGLPVADASSEITIVRTHASAAGIPATHTISVKVVAKVGSAEANVLEPLVEKGTALPADGSKTFRAAHDLRGGEPDSIAIELFQQVMGVPEPDLNLFVGSFLIEGVKDLEKGSIIRKGDDIIIRWKMDDNGLLNCAIDIPDLSSTFETGKFYVSSLGHEKFEGSDGAALADSVLESAQADVEGAKEVISEEDKAAVENLGKRLERQREAMEQAVDADTRRSVTEEARFVRQEVSRLKHLPRNRSTVLTHSLDYMVGAFDALLRPHIDGRLADVFDRLEGTARMGLRMNTEASLNESERAVSEMTALFQREYWNIPELLIDTFQDWARTRTVIDKALHERLVKEGAAAIQRQDMQGLRRTMGQMLQNFFSIGAAEKGVAALSGLMIG